MKKVLIVDRDKHTRRLIMAGLRKAQVRIFEADDCHQLKTLTTLERPDIVVVGSRRGAESEGLKTLRCLREHPQTRHCQILLITSEPETAKKWSGFSIGDIIRKPFSPIDLRKRIEVLITL